MDWLTDYFVEDPDFNNYVMKKGLGVRREKCSICERTIIVPAEIGHRDGYVCTQCSDDAIHDFVERH